MSHRGYEAGVALHSSCYTKVYLSFLLHRKVSPKYTDIMVDVYIRIVSSVRVCVVSVTSTTLSFSHLPPGGHNCVNRLVEL